MALPAHVGDVAPPLVDQAPEVRRWSREEYERAGELGLFGPTERLELIGGEVIKKVSPRESLHAAAVQRMTALLGRRIGDAHSLRVQLPMTLGLDSEPEPDLVVVGGTSDDYVDAHPSTAALVIEIADTTLRFDRTKKASLYAREGIPEYRILNLRDRVLECFREPFGHHHRRITRHPEDDQVTAHVGGEPFLVRDLLPRPRASKDKS